MNADAVAALRKAIDAAVDGLDTLTDAEIEALVRESGIDPHMEADRIRERMRHASELVALRQEVERLKGELRKATERIFIYEGEKIEIRKTRACDENQIICGERAYTFINEMFDRLEQAGAAVSEKS